MKFLVKGPLPGDEVFPKGSQDFTVVHDYLQTSTPKMQVRLRKRGQKVRNRSYDMLRSWTTFSEAYSKLKLNTAKQHRLSPSQIAYLNFSTCNTCIF